MNYHKYYRLIGEQDPVENLQIDGVETNHEGFFDENTHLSSLTTVLTTKVGDQKPSKNSQPQVRFTNGFAYTMPEAKRHCTFAGDECWTVRTHPVVDSISQTEGFTSGGQTLVIRGSGFTSTDQTVTIDGVECDVIDSTDEQITCLTGQANSPSLVDVWQPGSPGLTVNDYLTED